MNQIIIKKINPLINAVQHKNNFEHAFFVTGVQCLFLLCDMIVSDT